MSLFCKKKLYFTKQKTDVQYDRLLFALKCNMGKYQYHI